MNSWDNQCVLARTADDMLLRSLDNRHVKMAVICVFILACLIYILPNTVTTDQVEFPVYARTNPFINMSQSSYCNAHVERHTSQDGSNRQPYWHEVPPLPLCSSGLYDEQLRLTGYFPGKGTWKLTQDHRGDYQPDFCRFSDLYRFTTFKESSVLQECLMGQKVKYIVTMGDSHGYRYFNATIDLLRRHKFECIQVRTETSKKGSVSKEYYAKILKVSEESLKVSPRSCATCYSRQYTCTSQDKQLQVTVEHLAWNFVLDTTLLFSDSQVIKTPSSSTQELLLRYYFKERRPDLLILQPPFQHEVHSGRNTRDSVWVDLRHFTDMLRVYVLPNRTSVFWIPMGRHACTSKDKFPPHYSGLDSNEHINEMNKALFLVTEELKTTHGRQILSHFDLISLSCEFKDIMTDSGIHYPSFWYETVTYQLFQMWCFP